MATVQLATGPCQRSLYLPALICREYRRSQLGRGWAFVFARILRSCPKRSSITEFLELDGMDKPFTFDHCGLARECEHGYYCEDVTWKGRQTPIVCGKGTLCDQMGLTAPPPCPPGFFCSTPLMKQECVLGFHCPNGTHTPKRCASLGSSLECFLLWASTSGS